MESQRSQTLYASEGSKLGLSVWRLQRELEEEASNMASTQAYRCKTRPGQGVARHEEGSEVPTVPSSVQSGVIQLSRERRERVAEGQCTLFVVLGRVPE